MRSRRLLGCVAMSLLVACGEDIPPATYDLFTLELLELAEGDRVFPGQPLAYRIQYEGDLVRNLRFEAVFTHEASGESAAASWSENIQDTGRIDFRRSWNLRHGFLERAGRIRVQLQASLTATKKGSTPWVARSQSVLVELYPSLDGVEVRPLSGGPFPYGTDLEVTVRGKDLWGPVEVPAVDADTGVAVPELERSLSFDAGQPSISVSWAMRARALERVGTHRLRFVARYGELQAQSDPFAILVEYTVDAVAILLRDRAGALGPPREPYPRLSEVSELVLRIAGTQLAGRTFTINGGAPRVAGADLFELSVARPAFDDFADGEGRKKYEFVVRAGGMERSDSVTLQRWGIEGCEWRSAGGQALGEDEQVAQGSEIAMHVRLWGFPDTTTQWFIFKSPMAEFTVWERDPGGRPIPEEIDTLQNNDDEGDSFDAEIHGLASEARWTAVFDDEADPLDLHFGSAEYYFEVWVEDQVCSSSQILVPAAAR